MGMERVRPGSADELLRHQEFVRRLAFELVRDAARADDLVQDAWVQALERPPRAMATARAWFRTVLRNLAVRGAREQSRRERRERSAARPEDQLSTLEIGERLAHEQELVRAVEALREPYRSAVFLRWFEDLSPRAIAAREGVPVATVKTRLRRALELLRDALEHSHGPRAWALAFVRLAHPRHAVLPVATPLLAAGIVLVGVTLWVIPGSLRGRAATGSMSAMPTTVSVTNAAPAIELSTPGATTESARTTLVELDPPPEVGEAGRHAPPNADRQEEPALAFRGRVVFRNGGAAAGARVVLGPYATRTDTLGRFELALDDGSRVSTNGEITGYGSSADVDGDTPLLAFLDGWVPAVLPDFGARRDPARAGDPVALEPVELVLGDLALEIRGRVLEHAGAPAEGWRIALLDGTPAFTDHSRTYAVEELASGALSHVELGPDADFAFGGLTGGKRYRVRAWNQNTLEQIVSEPILAGSEDVVLRSPLDGWRPIVDGVVVALDGTPLAGVVCRLSMVEYRNASSTWMQTGQEVTTDEQGRFAFVDVPPAELFVRLKGRDIGGTFDLAPDDGGRNLRIELVGNGEVFFEAADRARAPDAVRVLDEGGERLRLEVDVAGGSKGVQDLPLSSDGTVRARVSELARWLVLLDDGREIERLPLQVRHGEEVRIRW